MILDTIAIGIDLGTTNSSVAVSRNGKAEIVKKPGGLEYTPSVFGFDKSKNKIVGQKAYDALFDATADGEPLNYKPEVKRIIGTPEVFNFSRAGISMTAEEISAEILKSLKQDIVRKYPDLDTGAAVITIPAAFSILQCEATKRAGQLAGFDQVVLLQEPIAAAIAYGFSAEKNETWLIYDLGGGTFDVAIVLSKDGVLSVLGHGGDNFLGGKNIDFAIVDNLFVPSLQSAYTFDQLGRENASHTKKFSRLKFLAERAKIELSNYPHTTVEFTGLGLDDEGISIETTIEVSANEVETAMQPIVDRTIEICRETLATIGLTPGDLSRVILIGGPTQAPYIRDRLSAALGVPVDTTADPITAVARGACIYGLGQRRQKNEGGEAPIGPSLSLKYQSLTSELQQTVVGKLAGVQIDDPHFIQIQSEDGTFSTDRILLRNGKFAATVDVKPNQTNNFWIYLTNESQNTVPATPDFFSITHGISVAAAPLPHSVGVSVLEGRGSSQSAVFDRLIERGSILPASVTNQYKTARALSVHSSDNPLLIRVGEGESLIPDRNAFVCSLGIKGSDLPHDLPAGTVVDLTVAINVFRELSVTAYIPSIDLRLNARATVQEEIVLTAQLEADLDVELARICRLEGDGTPADQIKIESAANNAQSSVRGANLDEDEKRKATKQLRDLRSILDDAEKAASLPQLKAKFDRTAIEADEAIISLRDADEIARLSGRVADLRLDAEKAFKAEDKVILGALIDRASDIGTHALRQDPSTWVYYFQSIDSGALKVRDQMAAQKLFEEGRAAISSNNLEALKQVCFKLNGLLDEGPKAESNKLMPGIMK